MGLLNPWVSGYAWIWKGAALVVYDLFLMEIL